MLLARAGTLGARPDTPVFPSAKGMLRDPASTAAAMRDAFGNPGFEWATSHVLRKTVSSGLDSNGLSARGIADQLGHARPSITLDRYTARKSVNIRGAKALETFG